MMVLMIVFALLFMPSGGFASPEDIDTGYSEGVKFYEKDSSFIDYDDAYTEYYRNAPSEIVDNIESKADFKKGFKRGYEDALKGDVDVNYSKDLGESLGRTLGFEDFYNNRDSDWRKAIPSDKSISRMYNLDYMPESYEAAFILSFKAAFQDAYEKAYEEAIFEPPKLSLEQGLNDGKDVGSAMGIIAAETDYLYKRSMNDTRDLLSDSEIRQRYRLNLGNNEYEDAFIQSFKREYVRAYNEKDRKSVV